MKFLVQLLRILIGGLFIFSGLVKANDPLGLAYKMEEFFEVWHTLWMIPFAKSLSIGMNALEIVCGIALWAGWQSKWNLRLLLALIVFFTGLTGYTYYTGFPKTCGCFGDCLPINASVSFYKDLALLIGIVVLTRYHQMIRPIHSARVAGSITLTAAFFSLGLEYFVLHHLPLVDCLPYHVGQNIPEARKQPPPPPGSTVMFVYEKDGNEIEFSATDFPPDFNGDRYRFIRRYETGEIPQPKIQGLVLFSADGNDTTEAVLNTDRFFLLFSENGPQEWGEHWNNLTRTADQKQAPLFIVTNKPDAWRQRVSNTDPNVRVLACDRTPIRTAARVNPTVYAVEKGIVLGKWALNDFPKLENPVTKEMPRSN